MLTLTHPVQLVSREEHAGNIPWLPPILSVGERPLRNLRFTIDIGLMGGGSAELQDLTYRLVDRVRARQHKKRARSWPTARTSSVPDTSTNSQKLQEVTSFKYLWATLCKEGTCSAEIGIRIASALVAAVARLLSLIHIWRCRRDVLCRSRWSPYH